MIMQENEKGPEIGALFLLDHVFVFFRFFQQI